MHGIDLSCQPGPGIRAARAGAPSTKGKWRRVISRPHQESRQRRRFRQRPLATKWQVVRYGSSYWAYMCYICVCVYASCKCVWKRVCMYVCV